MEHTSIENVEIGKQLIIHMFIVVIIYQRVTPSYVMATTNSRNDPKSSSGVPKVGIFEVVFLSDGPTVRRHCMLASSSQVVETNQNSDTKAAPTSLGLVAKRVFR